jgi:RimJ/RimL family protein N-acetyltransferase
MRKFLEAQEEWPRIMQWIAEKAPIHYVPVCFGAFAVEKDGEIVAATSLIEFNGANVYIQARIERYGLNRRLCYHTFDYAFKTLGAKRISSAIIGQNFESAKLTEHFGFRLEGVLHHFMPNGDNMYLSVLWPEHCKYLEV